MQNQYKVGWWVSLTNGAAGQIISLSAPGKAGVVIQIDAKGTTIYAMKSQIRERENPYTYASPRQGYRSKKEPNIEDGAMWGRHPADVE